MAAQQESQDWSSLHHRGSQCPVRETEGRLMQQSKDKINIINTRLDAVLGQYELFTDRNTSEHLAWTIGNGDPMHEVCISHSIP